MLIFIWSSWTPPKPIPVLEWVCCSLLTHGICHSYCIRGLGGSTNSLISSPVRGNTTQVDGFPLPVESDLILIISMLRNQCFVGAWMRLCTTSLFRQASPNTRGGYGRKWVNEVPIDFSPYPANPSLLGKKARIENGCQDHHKNLTRSKQRKK